MGDEGLAEASGVGRGAWSDTTPHASRPTPHAPRPMPHFSRFRLTRKAALWIAIYAASLLLAWLGGSRVLTHHETLFSEPAKEMLSGGDGLVPRIAGVPSTHYPPGMAWAISAAMALTGAATSWPRGFLRPWPALP